MTQNVVLFLLYFFYAFIQGIYLFKRVKKTDTPIGDMAFYVMFAPFLTVILGLERLEKAINSRLA